MKKKIFIFISLLAIIFVFNLDVKADEKVKITCDEKGYVNENFECNIKTDRKVTITYADELKITEGSKTLESDGKVKFKASKINQDGYDIALEYENDEGNKSVTTTTVIIITKPTASTTSKTTTTTTTKSKSSNNYLSSITIDGDKLSDFSKEKNKYEYNVENEITKIDINATLEDDKATLKIDGPKSLSVGENTFTISVTSEDNTTKYYKVIVIRDEEISTNTKIDEINITGYNLKIDGNSKTYYLDVKKDVNTLDIDVVLNDSKASYEIDGNSNLVNGSVIKIKVTAQNGNNTTYRIIINKPAEKESSNTLLIVIIIIILILIIGGIVTFVIIKKKKNNKKTKDEKSSSNKGSKKEDKDKSSDNNDDSDYDDSDELEKTKVLSFENLSEESDNTKTLNFNDFKF